MVLECLACGHPGAAGEAIDFFDCLNSVPVAQRHPHLGPPTYLAMLPHLSRLAAYPPGFRGWEEEVETDAATFHSFRSVTPPPTVLQLQIDHPPPSVYATPSPTSPAPPPAPMQDLPCDSLPFHCRIVNINSGRRKSV